MSSLAKITDATLYRLLGFCCLSKITLAINGAGAATVANTGAINYLNDGVFKQKAALSAQSIAITHDQNGNPVASGVAAYVQPVSTTVYYLLSLTAAGAVQVSQGGYAGQKIDNSPAGLVFTSQGGLPELPAGSTPIGLIKVVTNSSTTFTPATTALDAAGLTVTYFDICLMPKVAP
jgi:hypothetical protein